MSRNTMFLKQIDENYEVEVSRIDKAEMVCMIRLRGLCVSSKNRIFKDESEAEKFAIDSVYDFSKSLWAML